MPQNFNNKYRTLKRTLLCCAENNMYKFYIEQALQTKPIFYY